MVFIQEIRDISMSSPIELLSVVNTGRTNTTDEYAILLSERYGSTSSKEAYGWIYKPSIITPLSHRAAYTNNDPATFPERPPHTVLWMAVNSGYVFRTLGIHADPAWWSFCGPLVLVFEGWRTV
jgi:hypothetical protein